MGEPPVIIGTLKFMTMATASIFGAAYGTLAAILGGIDGNSIAIGTTLSVSVGFASIILKQVINNQKAIWEIVNSEKEANKQLKKELEYVTWEREKARFRANERTDPGPFILSPQLMDQTKKPDTTSFDRFL